MASDHFNTKRRLDFFCFLCRMVEQEEEKKVAHCLICFEELPDALPPCGTILEPLFHTHCLAMAMAASEKNRCPHCNVECPPSAPRRQALHATYNSLGDALFVTIDTTKHSVNNLMDRWLQNRNHWSAGPVFIPITRGLMDQGDAGVIRTSVCNLISEKLACLCTPPKTCSTFSSPCDQAVICRHRDATLQIETEAIIRRTALQMGTMGAIPQDGFTLAMSRSRYSERTFRPLSLYERRELVPLS